MNKLTRTEYIDNTIRNMNDINKRLDKSISVRERIHNEQHYNSDSKTTISDIIFIVLFISFLIFFIPPAFAKCVVQQQTVKQGNTIEQQIIETCDDNQKFDVGKIGFSGKLELFKPHPNYPREFMHNSTTCKWFLDNELKGNSVIGYQGIICNIRGNWSVVDKF